MADAATIAQLRANLADTGTPPAYSDAELSAYLDAAGGSEPRARLAALLPLWAEAAGRTDYAAGSGSEKASQVWDHLGTLLDHARAEVAALDAAAASGGTTTVAVPVAWTF